MFKTFFRDVGMLDSNAGQSRKIRYARDPSPDRPTKDRRDSFTGSRKSAEVNSSTYQYSIFKTQRVNHDYSIRVKNIHSNKVGLSFKYNI